MRIDAFKTLTVAAAFCVVPLLLMLLIIAGQIMGIPL